jgi:hypothetical protein
MVIASLTLTVVAFIVTVVGSRRILALAAQVSQRISISIRGRSSMHQGAVRPAAHSTQIVPLKEDKQACRQA